MGRITIFGLTDCRHCMRVKAKLSKLGVPYEEINLSSYPHRRNDMLTLTDRLTVPQVFFNDTHIGGADETLAKMKEVGDFAKYYITRIRPKVSPTDTRLAIQSEVPGLLPSSSSQRTVIIPPPRHQEKSVEMPNGEKWTVLQLFKKLKSILDIRNRKFHIHIYSKCFVGKDAVLAFQEHFEGIDSERDAVKFGRHLQKLKLLYHVVEDHGFKNEMLYYHLQCHHTPNILNSFRIWTERVDPDPMALLSRLKKKLSKVESKVTDDQGMINYKKAVILNEFLAFEEAICELQQISMDTMDESTKLAFGINVYNIFIQYGFMKLGIGQSSMARGAFFSRVKMNIGGDILSFNDLENGVLRGNRKPPYSFSPPFAQDDTRIRLAVTKNRADCRIHFALNCGAKSCPPVKNFSSQSIEEELRIVAQAFCEQEENVRLDPTKSTIHLNKILDWYRSDFADSKTALPMKLLEFLRGERKETLKKMLASGKPISIQYNTYDWGTNASEFTIFRPKFLKTNRPSMKALFTVK